MKQRVVSVVCYSKLETLSPGMTVAVTVDGRQVWAKGTINIYLLIYIYYESAI